MLMRTVGSFKNHRVCLAKPSLCRRSYLKTGRWYERRIVRRGELGKGQGSNALGTRKITFVLNRSVHFLLVCVFGEWGKVMFLKL